jgi:hypothetical protein
MGNGGNLETEYFEACFLDVSLWIIEQPRLNRKRVSNKCTLGLLQTMKVAGAPYVWAVSNGGM